MATLTVRNLDPQVIDELKRAAAASGRSMESEARLILARAAQRTSAAEEGGGLGSRIRERFAPLELNPTVVSEGEFRWVDFGE